jgi:hypothetical protein
MTPKVRHPASPRKSIGMISTIVILLLHNHGTGQLKYVFIWSRAKYLIVRILPGLMGGWELNSMVRLSVGPVGGKLIYGA